MSQRDTYGQALKELGSIEPRVIVLDADVSKSTRSGLFGKEFPDRFYNCGIAEQNMMGIAAGLAASGLIPFVNTFSFLATFRAGEQLRTAIAYPRLNVKVAANYGGLSDSFDGPTHQAIADIAVVRALPNVTVVVPADAIEMKKALPAIARHEGPVWLRICRNPTPVVFSEDFTFTLGRAVKLREGSDVTLVSTGIVLARMLKAADLLHTQGVSARVLSISTLKPLDEAALLAAAKETGAIVTCEEHNIHGGLGAAVCELTAGRIPVPVVRVGIPDTFAESGDYDLLLDRYGLSVDRIVQAAKEAMAMKR